MDGPHRGGHHRIISCLVDGTGLRSLTCLWKRFPKPRKDEKFSSRLYATPDPRLSVGLQLGINVSAGCSCQPTGTNPSSLDSRSFTSCLAKDSCLPGLIPPSKPDSFRLADHPGAHGRDARYRNTNQEGGAISLPAVANQIMTGPEKLL
jgi:hypothetical protein